MQPSKLHSLSVDVADLRQRIEYWRSTRMKRGRMPKDLWVEATRLARRHGVWAISKLLRLNYEALTAWTAGKTE